MVSKRVIITDSHPSSPPRGAAIAGTHSGFPPEGARPAGTHSRFPPEGASPAGTHSGFPPEGASSAGKGTIFSPHSQILHEVFLWMAHGRDWVFHTEITENTERIGCFTRKSRKTQKGIGISHRKHRKHGKGNWYFTQKSRKTQKGVILIFCVFCDFCVSLKNPFRVP